MAHIAILGLVVGFGFLGFWQLQRLDERRATNQLIAERFNQPHTELSDLENVEPAEAEYLRVVASGVFLPAEEVLIRSQVFQGNAGFHVITPLEYSNGQAILVNRGWIPLLMDEAPVVQAPPPTGTTQIVGWVHLTQERPPLGREESPGEVDVMNRVDIERIASQTPVDLADVYLVELGEREELPIPVSSPDFTDEGSHFSYAFQWFGFAVVVAVGYMFLVRRRVGQSTGKGLAKSSTTS